MASPLAGLTAFDNVPEGTVSRSPAEFGAPQNPVHGAPGERSDHGRHVTSIYPVEVEQGDTPEATAGSFLGLRDHTPTSHTAPTFQGIEHDPLVYAEGSFDLHGEDLGASSVKDFHLPYEVHPDFHLNTSAGSSILATPPAQLAQGLDVDQGSGDESPYGFSMWHQFRNWFTDAVPRNHGASGDRPFFGKHPMRVTTYDTDSQYGPAGDTTQGMNLRPTPKNLPQAYSQPPNPTISPETGYGDTESPMAWW